MMMRNFLLSLMVVGAAVPGWAGELTPGNIVGRYNISASVGFHKVYLKFRVLDTKEFEIQRVYANGNEDEVCSGTYRMNPRLFWEVNLLGVAKIFKGVFNCPSNRSKDIDFSIDFKDRSTEDLVKGTTVAVTSSLAPGYVIHAFVKKQ